MELERHLSTEANDIVVIAVVPVNLDVVQPELHVGVVGVLHAQPPLVEVLGGIQIEVVVVVEQVGGPLLVPLLAQPNTPVLQVIGKNDLGPYLALSKNSTRQARRNNEL